MKIQKTKIFIVILMLTNSVKCIEPVTTVALIAAAISGGIMFFSSDKREKCSECCEPKTRCCEPNLYGLSADLDRHVFGQHIVKKLVISSLKGRLATDKTPKKALVLSFHGWTGGGKNYVSEFIAANLFKSGMDSPNVHHFFSRVDFPDENMAKIYETKLQKYIQDEVSKCPRSLFIFDEIEKMPIGMMDGLKPFIDFPGKVHGVDYRRSIFLFLSNTGGPEITNFMIKSWENGKMREEITVTDMQVLIEKGVFNEIGGLHNSVLISHSLVDLYIPFLPLERKHVERCIANEFLSHKVTPTNHLIQKVADQLQYFPPETKLYSTTGCKRVYEKVNYLVADMEYD